MVLIIFTVLDWIFIYGTIFLGINKIQEQKPGIVEMLGNFVNYYEGVAYVLVILVTLGLMGSERQTKNSVSTFKYVRGYLDTIMDSLAFFSAILLLKDYSLGTVILWQILVMLAWRSKTQKRETKK